MAQLFWTFLLLIKTFLKEKFQLICNNFGKRFTFYTIHIAWKYFKTLLILWNFVSFNFVSKYFSPLRKYPFPKRSFINVSSFEPLTLPPPIRFQIWAECYPLYTTNGPKQKTSISTVIQINKAVGLLETPYNTYVKGF